MNTQKPTLFQVIAWMTLVSGVVNLFWGFAASGTALATIIGVICTPLTILPAILGVFELIYAAKLFSEPPQVLKPSINIAILEIANALSLNFFSVAVGILALVFYNDNVVKAYFARLNGTLSGAEVRPPEPVSQPTPASLPDPAPEPATEEPVPSQSAPSEQPSEETPAKPKRGPRKVAK